jgi:hypothetical protein
MVTIRARFRVRVKVRVGWITAGNSRFLWLREVREQKLFSAFVGTRKVLEWHGYF